MSGEESKEISELSELKKQEKGVNEENQWRGASKGGE